MNTRLTQLTIFAIIAVSIATAQDTKILTLNDTDPMFLMNYSVQNSSNEMHFIATIFVDNFNTSGWDTTDGSQGFFVQFGFQDNTTSLLDLVTCYYNYTNSAEDSVICLDGYLNTTDANASAVLNETTQDWKFDMIDQMFDDNKTTGNFTFQINTLLSTGDSNDTVFTINSTQPFQWMLGDITNSAMQLSSPIKSGNSSLDLTFIQPEEGGLGTGQGGLTTNAIGNIGFFLANIAFVTLISFVI